MIFDQCGTVEIDSMRIRIPSEIVQINAPELLYRKACLYAVDEDTGEQVFLRETDLHSSSFSNGEYSTTYNRKAQKHDSAQFIDTINIGASAKLLRRWYFDGFNNRNLNYLLDNIEAQGIITIPDRSIFIENARCTDVDLKQDRVGITPDQWEQEKQAAKALTKSSQMMGKGFVDFKGQGLQWSERNRQQTNTGNPLLKLYPKRPDFDGKSKVFYDKWLNGITKDVYRLEGTIKNKNDFNTYGIEKTLTGLLNTPQEQLRNTLFKIACKQIDLHADMQYREPSNDLTPQQQKDITLIQITMKVYECTAERAIGIICAEWNWSGDRLKHQKKVLRRAWDIHTQNQWSKFREKHTAAA